MSLVGPGRHSRTRPLGTVTTGAGELLRARSRIIAASVNSPRSASISTRSAMAIVLGSHGRSGLTGAFVADAVAAYSRRSMLIVHQH